MKDLGREKQEKAQTTHGRFYLEWQTEWKKKGEVCVCVCARERGV